MKYKKGEFVTVPNIKSLEGLKPQLQAIFVYICTHANEKGVCFPSIGTLAKKAGVSYRTASNSVGELSDLGFLKKRNVKVAGRQTSNTYQIMIIEAPARQQVPSGRQDMPSTRHEVPTDQAGGAYTPRQEVPTNYTHKNKTQITKLNITPSVDIAGQGSEFPPIEEQTELENESEKILRLFTAFWSTYPRKVAKPNASIKWKALMRNLNDGEQEALTVKIILAIEKFKRSEDWQKDGGMYIPHPSTFINQRRWEDEIKIHIGLNAKLNEDIMNNPPPGVKTYKQIKK